MKVYKEKQFLVFNFEKVDDKEDVR
jgi:hypothetical protein